MKTKLWMRHLRRALSSPGNLIAGAGALCVSAILWNPLPLILYGLGEPVWLYRATTTERYTKLLAAEEQQAAMLRNRRSLAWLYRQIVALLEQTPCGVWTQRNKLPAYAATYVRLVELRDQTARIVATRDGAAQSLEQDVVTRMDDMLRAYLTMAKERLLFHCALAKIYPQELAPEDAGARSELREKLERSLIGATRDAVRSDDTRFVSLDDACAEVRDKIAGFEADVRVRPEHADVYGPLVDTLEKRLDELARRGKNDLDMAAQLRVFPDQFEIISSKLATTQADVAEVVSDMKLLLEQTDDTVSFAEDMRTSGRLWALHN
jgi:hypothetical protein